MSAPRTREQPLTSFEPRDELARVHPDAHAWAVRCCRGEREEAQDVLHQAYCKVLEGKARFDGRSSFKTWLFGVIQRTASEERRWRWLRLGRLERWWRESTDGDGHTPPPSIDHERVTNLQAALARLSKRQQEVLHLVFYQEMTVQDAADVLEMPVGTARTHYERGKARLRALLARESTP